MRLRLLSADDIFISYSRKDAATYALGLAEALTKVGFSCFLDRFGTDANSDLPPSLLKKLKSCAMLIVVCTKGATDSYAIEQEISNFSRVNGTSKIVPINFDNEAQGARWQHLLTGLAAESETVDALLLGNPSRQVITRIEKSFNYARSKQRLRRYAALAAALLLVSFVTAGTSYLYAQRQLARASAATEAARNETDRERQAAGAARREADEQERLAVLAEAKQVAAEGKATAAEGKATTALQRQHLAEVRERDAMLNVVQQEKISHSLRLASQSARSLEEHLDLGLLLSAESLEIYDTYEARNSLLSALQHRPRLLGHLNMGTSAVRDALLSANDETFVMLDGSGHLTVWDVVAGKICDIPYNGVLLPGDFALSPNGKLLAVASSELTLWNVKACRIEREIKTRKSNLTRLTFDPTGKYLAFFGDRDIFLVKLDRDVLLELPSQIDSVGSGLAFSADGRMLAAAGKSVTVWDMNGGEPIVQSGWPPPPPPKEVPLIGYGNPLMTLYWDNFDVTFSPDGKVLVTNAIRGNKVIFWDIAERRQFHEYNTDSSSASVAFNHKGTLLAVGGGGTILLLDTSKMRVVERLSETVKGDSQRLMFTRDDQKLVSVTDKIRIWDISDDQHLRKVLTGHSGKILGAAFSPDGKYLLSCDSDGNPVMLRDARSGEVLGQPFQEAINGARGFSFSRDGKLLAMITGRHSALIVQVWDFAKSRLISTPYRSGKDRVDVLALSPDGKLLAVSSLVSGRSRLTFWDVATEKSCGAPINLRNEEFVSSLTFNPSGDLLAYGTSNGEIILLDTQTLRPVGQMSMFSKFGLNEVMALAFSPDGKTLASGGSQSGTAILWDVASRSRRRVLFSPDMSAYTRALAFSADGKMLAVASNDFRQSTIILWDVETEQQIGQSLKAHGAGISHLAFSPRCKGCPDDARLVSGSEDGNLLLWDMGVRSWQGRACAVSDRRLTTDERDFYLKDSMRREICSVPSSLSMLRLPSTTGGHIASLRPETPWERIMRTAYQPKVPPVEKTIEERLQPIILKQLGLDPRDVLPGSRFKDDLNVSEPNKASLFDAVGKEFGIDISIEDARKILNVRDLLDYVERRTGARNPK